MEFRVPLEARYVGSAGHPDALWALKAWGVKAATVTGHASTREPRPRALAAARAGAVADALRDQGMESRTESGYPARGQRERERKEGEDAFRRADIRVEP